MEEKQTIEAQVAAAILEKDVAELVIEGKTYHVAPPSIATLILVSEIVSTFPIVDADFKAPKEQVFNLVLHHARYFTRLGELAAVLILGAKNLTEETTETITERRFFGLWRTKKEIKVQHNRMEELARIINENVSPSVLFDLIVGRINRMDIASFFAITISLSEANILKPTREMGEEKH